MASRQKQRDVKWAHFFLKLRSYQTTTAYISFIFTLVLRYTRCPAKSLFKGHPFSTLHNPHVRYSTTR